MQIRIKTALTLVVMLATLFPLSPQPVNARPLATITVRSALDHADISTPDVTSDGVCNDTIVLFFGTIGVLVTTCSLRSAIKTSFETAGPDLIDFAPAISGTVIALKGNSINWAASNTTVDGQGQNIVINGAGMNAGQDMITISGSDNVLRSVELTTARRNALTIGDNFGVNEGNRNLVDSTKIFGTGIGVWLTGSPAGGGMGNRVYYSVLGAPLSGAASCDSARSNVIGVRISNNAVNATLVGNEIYCSTLAGIQVFDAATAGAVIDGNSIGAGLRIGDVWGNGVGVHVENAQRTLIRNNFIRSSTGAGIYVSGASTNDVSIERNSIGDEDRGGGPTGLAGFNGSDGVFVEGVPIADVRISLNSIPGNRRDGVRISNSQAIGITDNRIGFTSSGGGEDRIGRNVNGVSLIDGTRRVHVYVNTIAYNENLGVWINGEATSGNGVSDNAIHSNGNSGVEIGGGADYNAIGAEVYSPAGIVRVNGNVIYSNTNEGVYINGAGTTNNLIVGNLIGALAGRRAPNGRNGVLLANQTTDNVIGGLNSETLTQGNTIGANGASGIWITDRANRNSVAGNAIGTTGDPAVSGGNSQYGILLSNNVTGNVIGGGAQEGNRVTNSGADGLALQDASVTGNTIYGNEFLFNERNGIGIYGARTNAFLGSSASLIETDANTQSGLYVAAAADTNTFSLVRASYNQSYGVLFDNSSTNTLVKVDAVRNGRDGIGERNGATNNVWSDLVTYENGGLGIDKDASDDAQNIVAISPVTITSYALDTGAMTVAGLSALTSYEVYTADPDPSGYGEGERGVAAFTTGVAETSANVVIPAAYRVTNCFTVLRTSSPASEFSRNYCRLSPQSIDFPALADRTLAAPLTFNVTATATSGLPVGFVTLRPAVCTVSGTGVVSIVTVGECILEARQPGNATVGPAVPLVRSFNVTTTPQTIVFTQPADRPMGSSAFDAEVSATSGLAVSLVSESPAVCTVTGVKVTLRSAGTCTLRASQAGNATYDAALPVERRFAVTQGSQTITFGQPADVLLRNGPFGLSATSSSGLPVNFSGGVPGVCSVSSDGRVTVIGPGACIVTAAQSGNADYLAALPVRRTISVQQTVFLPLTSR